MWKQCANLPSKMDSRQSTVINGMVYYGGGLASAGNDCFVYCYNPYQDQWTTLPQLTVKRFGLGKVVGKPVVVGGLRKDNSASNEVSIYHAEERFFKWKKYPLPMPTARSFPTVVSYKFNLIVAGGIVDGDYVRAVEFLNFHLQQWFSCISLPVPCYNMSAVVIQDKCCLLGGFNNDGTLNHVFYTTINDISFSDLSYMYTLSAWNGLPETPTYGPMATVIAGSLFILGGDETCTRTATQERIHVYSPTSNSWVYVDDLPAPRIEATATALSSTEILVIGGRGSKDTGTVNTVYKGVVQIVT